MSLIWTKSGPYRRKSYKDEADFEEAIILVQKALFGEGRFYLDVKKKIGAKGTVRNIPDGYLIDLSDSKPRIYVVENELSSHDPLRHIAVQILEFSLSFETEKIGIKKILFNALQNAPDDKNQCERYAIDNGFRNLDHLLESLVFEVPFSALVIIDEIPERLENTLAQKFQFGVEVLELARYENEKGDRTYRFEPFLEDITEDVRVERDDRVSSIAPVATSDVDTIVVPAWDEGFHQVFLGENRWWQIRIHGTMRPQLKYIAAYRVAPKSAITHIAPIKSIEPWKDSGKFVVNFAEPAREVGPIPLVKGGKVKALQNLRYTTRKRLESATNLDEVW